MLADSLRKSILQAAIEGKLTQREPDDGDARDLLAEIQKEKARLVMEGKIRRSTPLPPVDDDEIPFDIPDNWCWVHLSDITKEIGDGIHGTPKFSASGNYYFINGNNLSNGRILIKSDTNKISQIEYEKYKKNLDENTVLLSINGTIGNIAYYDNEAIILGKSACYINLMSNIEKAYIRLLLSSKFFLDYATNKATQTTIKNVSLREIRLFHIPLPPLAEQRRIVARLEELLPLVDELGKDERELDVIEREFPDAIRKSLLQAAIEGKLTKREPGDGDARDLLAEIQKEKARLVREGKIRKSAPLPPVGNDEIPFDIPDNWCWVRLGEITAVNPRNALPDDMITGFLPMERIEAGYGSKCNPIQKTWKEIKSGFTHFQDDDIIIAKITPCFQNLKSAIVSGLTNGYGAGTTELHVLRTYGNTVSNKYLLFIAKSRYFIERGVDVMTGTAGQQRVGSDFIKNFLIPLPPLAEQRRIVARLEELLPLVEDLKEV